MNHLETHQIASYHVQISLDSEQNIHANQLLSLPLMILPICSQQQIISIDTGILGFLKAFDKVPHTLFVKSITTYGN